MLIRTVYQGIEKEYQGEDFGVDENNTDKQILDAALPAMKEDYGFSDGTIPFVVHRKTLKKTIVATEGLEEEETPVAWIIPNPVAGNEDDYDEDDYSEDDYDEEDEEEYEDDTSW